MRPTCASRDGLLIASSVLFLVVGFLWALGCTSPPQCTLTVTVEDGVGSVDPNGGSFPCGSTVVLTAFPPPNRVFDNWGGDLKSDANPATLLMDSDKTVSVDWLP
jgi:hypothetical protein